MAWIDLTGLGTYHKKIKEWIEKNKYIHPANHPATMIIQDNLNQFVSKEQKNIWNNKLDADANAVSASKLNKAININGVSFDGSQDITISSHAIITSIEMELDKNINKISIDKQYTVTQETKIWLFIDGIKLIKNKHFTINDSDNSLVLNESYSTKTNVEIIIF